jgi:hypothetical protein
MMIEKRNGYIYVDGKTCERGSWRELGFCYVLALVAIFWFTFRFVIGLSVAATLATLWYAFPIPGCFVAVVAFVAFFITLLALDIRKNG